MYIILWIGFVWVNRKLDSAAVPKYLGCSLRMDTAGS